MLGQWLPNAWARLPLGQCLPNAWARLPNQYEELPRHRGSRRRRERQPRCRASGLSKLRALGSSVRFEDCRGSSARSDRRRWGSAVAVAAAEMPRPAVVVVVAVAAETLRAMSAVVVVAGEMPRRAVAFAETPQLAVAVVVAVLRARVAE